MIWSPAAASLGVADRQDRDLAGAHDPLGDAAGDQVANPGATVRAHHDQIGALSGRTRG
jgi:hypothetical protein